MAGGLFDTKTHEAPRITGISIVTPRLFSLRVGGSSESSTHGKIRTRNDI